VQILGGNFCDDRPKASYLFLVRIDTGDLVLAIATLSENRVGTADQLFLPAVILGWISAISATQLRYLCTSFHAGQNDSHLVRGGPLTTLFRLTHSITPGGGKSRKQNLSKVSFPLKHYRVPSFLIKNFDCDFVVIVRLNRGTKDGSGEVRDPEYSVLPVSVVHAAPRTEDWGRVDFRNMPDFDSYRDRWELIAEFLASVGR